MDISKKLLKLTSEMKDLEKKEQRLTGTLDNLFKTLQKDLDDSTIPEKDIVRAVRTRIKEIKKKREKANKQLQDKMEIITEMMENLED